MLYLIQTYKERSRQTGSDPVRGHLYGDIVQAGTYRDDIGGGMTLRCVILECEAQEGYFEATNWKEPFTRDVVSPEDGEIDQEIVRKRRYYVDPAWLDGIRATRKALADRPYEGYSVTWEEFSSNLRDLDQVATGV